MPGPCYQVCISASGRGKVGLSPSHTKPGLFLVWALNPYTETHVNTYRLHWVSTRLTYPGILASGPALRSAEQLEQRHQMLQAPTLACEAPDVEVVALDTHHLSFARVPTAVALDDGGATSGAVGVLLIGNCWGEGERKTPGLLSSGGHCLA